MLCLRPGRQVYLRVCLRTFSSSCFFFGYWHRLIESKYWKDHFNFNSTRMRLSAMNIMLALISLNYFHPAFRETSYRHSRLPAFKPFSGSSRGGAQHKRGNKRGTIISVIWERLSGELHSGVRTQSFSSGSLHVWSQVRWILSEEPLRTMYLFTQVMVSPQSSPEISDRVSLSLKGVGVESVVWCPHL